MITSIVNILVGFIIGILENSSWFQSLFKNKLYNSLIQGANKKVKNSDDTLESFYKELFKVEIEKDNVNLYYRITFVTKNLNK